MADEIQPDKPAPKEEHISATKPAEPALPQANPFKLPDADPRTRRRGWTLRVLLSLATGALVSITAYVCAWYEYRNFHYFQLAEPASFWQFATTLDKGGMLKACLLAGAFTFALCLIAGEGVQQKRSIVALLLTYGATALVATITAVVISALHLPSGH